MTKYRFPSPVHAIVQIERDCSCGSTIVVQVHDCGEVSDYFTLEDAITGHNTPLFPICCPKCGKEEWPQYLSVFDQKAGKRLFRSPIGTEQLPVIIPEGEAETTTDVPYAYMLSKDEGSVLDRGIEKIEDHFKECEEEFWQDYCKYALEHWPGILKDLTVAEFSRAYAEMRIDISPHMSPAGFRKDAGQRFIAQEEKQKFWREANHELVYSSFLWLDPAYWRLKEWVTKYGRERVTWLTLHLPLPEEIEGLRTRKLAEIASKKNGEHGILWERIAQLGRQVEKQTRRSQTLASQVMELRQENDSLRQKIKELSTPNKIEVCRDPVDVQKIRDLKGLIRELRGEVARLENLLPAPEVETLMTDTIEEEERAAESDKVVIPEGTTIAVFGWPLPEQTIQGCRTVWHDGDNVDLSAQRLAREADILVFLTRYGSHSVMWWLKETAIDLGKPVYFLRERNVDRIFDVVNKQYKEAQK